jgi:hypothetical protein
MAARNVRCGVHLPTDHELRTSASQQLDGDADRQLLAASGLIVDGLIWANRAIQF